MNAFIGLKIQHPGQSLQAFNQSKSTMFASTACLSIFIFSASLGNAQDQSYPWESAEPFSLSGQEIIAALEDHSSPDDQATEILLKDVRLDYLPDGRVNRTDYFLYRYLTRDAAQNAHVDESWAPWYENLSLIHI